MSSPAESMDREKSPEEYYAAHILELTDPQRLLSTESPLDDEVISIREEATPHIPVALIRDTLQCLQQQTWAAAEPMDFTTTGHRPVASEVYIRRINQTLLDGTIKLQRQQSEWMRLHCTCDIPQGPFRFPDSLHPTVPLPNYIINNAEDHRFVMHYTNAVEQTVAEWVDSLQQYLYPAAKCHCSYRSRSERSLMSSLICEPHLDPASQLPGSNSGRLHAPERVVPLPSAGESVGGQLTPVMASLPSASLHSDQAHGRRDDVSIVHETQDSHSTATVPLPVASQQKTSYHEKTVMRPVQPLNADPAEYALLPSTRKKTGDATEVSVTAHEFFCSSSSSWGAGCENPPESYPDPPGWYRDPPVPVGIQSAAMPRSDPPPIITIQWCRNQNRYDDNVMNEVGNENSKLSIMFSGLTAKFNATTPAWNLLWHTLLMMKDGLTNIAMVPTHNMENVISFEMPLLFNLHQVCAEENHSNNNTMWWMDQKLPTSPCPQTAAWEMISELLPSGNTPVEIKFPVAANRMSSGGGGGGNGNKLATVVIKGLLSNTEKEHPLERVAVMEIKVKNSDDSSSSLSTTSLLPNALQGLYKTSLLPDQERKFRFVVRFTFCCRRCLDVSKRIFA